jgi:hypothetical protein
MRFSRVEDFEFQDTPLKRKYILRRQRKEREACPLFAGEIAAQQAAGPTIDEEMERRAKAFAEGHQKDRDARARKWREARKRLFSFPPDQRRLIVKAWNEGCYPLDPWYFSGMLLQIERGNFNLHKPPWVWDPEELAEAHRKMDEFCRRMENSTFKAAGQRTKPIQDSKFKIQNEVAA